jgi:hypothetical protein
LRRPGKARLSGEESLLYMSSPRRKNGGMARVSAPLGEFDHWTSTLGEQSSPFYPQVGRPSASRGAGTYPFVVVHRFCCVEGDLPPTLKRVMEEDGLSSLPSSTNAVFYFYFPFITLFKFHLKCYLSSLASLANSILPFRELKGETPKVPPS